ncbi:unnamed protein product [Rotaria magnacalcarata]|uniref:EF-hand domain-containing protein n=1 Tax=Rotaria magnacalcarata TaxID=392030 RepID=A0A816PAC0_9BILA|nr:unnamed protein product [Rotaria magnacalcarata]CAF1616499.1 unnamed protein product [Rotaria magnacalcarata]CAF2046183.1 unnamed protein product [Rotaria magnacalcarata]CAF4142867.1 unnamed protein product [Rotaria magnacalcarata]CAF4345655.1 unnamed protein product [Rotaria magnacalcarata]
MGCTGSTEKKKHKNTTLASSDDSFGLHNQDVDDIKVELSDATISTLLDETKFTHEEIIDWWHGFLADCPSGLLDKDKFIEVYQHKYPSGKAKGFCDHVFRTFNPDKRAHAIDFERFMCAINVTLKGTSDEKLNWAFTMYDINGDQRISKKEMLSVLKAMLDLLGKDKKGPNKPQKQVDRIFLRIDSNHDNYISKEEFFSGCRADENIRAILAPYY